MACPTHTAPDYPYPSVANATKLDGEVGLGLGFRV